MKFVAYYRVSTQRQGASGLGLESQQMIVRQFVGTTRELLAEYTEVESGSRRKLIKRVELARALAKCKKEGATLVVAKLDRLARDAAFVLGLRESGVEFVACDFPQANRLMIGILACIGEYERDLISLRTKEALQAAKRRGKKLGGNRGVMPGRSHMKFMRIKKKEHESERKKELRKTVFGAIEICAGNLTEAADLLNRTRIPTTSGRGEWRAGTVRRFRNSFSPTTRRSKNANSEHNT